MQSENERRTQDAVLLLNMADQFREVVRILNKELGSALQDPTARSIASQLGDDGRATGISTSGNESADHASLMALAEGVFAHYKAQPSIIENVGQTGISTLEMLLTIFNIYRVHDAGSFEDALDLIESTGLIPTSPSLNVIQITRQVDQQVKQLDDSLARNLPDLVLLTMSCLYHLYVAAKGGKYTDQAVVNDRLDMLREKARRVMIFAGLLRFRMSAETYAQCARLDVFLH